MGTIVADIFISYSQKDRTRAQQVAEALRASGWKVWCEAYGYVGSRFRAEIAEELHAARCVMVLWSVTSVQSQRVIDEAQQGLNRGVLVQALLDNVPPPFGFGQNERANLADWDRTPEFGELTRLRAAVQKIVAASVREQPEPEAITMAPHPKTSAKTEIPSADPPVSIVDDRP